MCYQLENDNNLLAIIYIVTLSTIWISMPFHPYFEKQNCKNVPAEEFYNWAYPNCFKNFQHLYECCKQHSLMLKSTNIMCVVSFAQSEFFSIATTTAKKACTYTLRCPAHINGNISVFLGHNSKNNQNYFFLSSSSFSNIVNQAKDISHLPIWPVKIW